MSEPPCIVLVTDPLFGYGPFLSKGEAETHAALWLSDFRYRIVECVSTEHAEYLLKHPHVIE